MLLTVLILLVPIVSLLSGAVCGGIVFKGYLLVRTCLFGDSKFGHDEKEVLMASILIVAGIAALVTIIALFVNGNYIYNEISGIFGRVFQNGCGLPRCEVS